MMSPKLVLCFELLSCCPQSGPKTHTGKIRRVIDLHISPHLISPPVPILFRLLGQQLASMSVAAVLIFSQHSASLSHVD